MERITDWLRIIAQNSQRGYVLLNKFSSLRAWVWLPVACFALKRVQFCAACRNCRRFRERRLRRLNLHLEPARKHAKSAQSPSISWNIGAKWPRSLVIDRILRRRRQNKPAPADAGFPEKYRF